MDFLYWNNCLIRISLDIVLPIYEGIGLHLTDKKLFQKLLKRRVTENLNNGKNFPWLDEKIVQEFSEDIRLELCEKNYDNFVCFATTIFDNRGDQWMAWSHWKDALTE